MSAHPDTHCGKALLKNISLFFDLPIKTDCPPSPYIKKNKIEKLLVLDGTVIKRAWLYTRSRTIKFPGGNTAKNQIIGLSIKRV